MPARTWIKRIVLGVLISCLFALSPVSAQNSGKIRVGVIAPLSGPAAVYGLAVKNGIELALKELGEKTSVEILFEDDQFKPSASVSAFNKLVDYNRVDLVVSVASTPSLAVAPLAESRRVPLLAWASDASVTRHRRFSIRTYPSGESEGRAIGAETLSKGHGRIASFHAVSDYSQSVWRGFITSGLSSKIVMDEEVPPELSDFRPLLARAKKADAQAFFICLNVGLAGVFARQVQEAGFPLKMFGCENLNNLAELEIARGALDDAWFVAAGVSEDFRLKYRAAYGNEDVLSGAAIHHDIINLLNSLFDRKPSGEALIKTLLTSAAFSGAVSWGQFKKTEEDQFLDLKLMVKKMSELRR